MITVGKSSAFPELICYFSTSQVSDVDDFLNNKTRNRLGARKIAKKNTPKDFFVSRNTHTCGKKTFRDYRFRLETTK